MDESNIKNYGSLEYWKSRPPEEVLEAFIYELRGPLVSAKGWVEMMQLSDSKELKTKALESIYKVIIKIEEENELIKEYLVEWKKSNNTT